MRAEICPVRYPPKSEPPPGVVPPRALVIWPKLELSIALTGSARFTWFKTLVKEPSILIFNLSVIAKDLPREVERLTVPGPVTTPMPPLPNRPIGARSTPGLSPMVQAWPSVQPGVAGQTKALVLNHWFAVGFEIEPLAMRSTCWGR